MKSVDVYGVMSMLMRRIDVFRVHTMCRFKERSCHRRICPEGIAGRTYPKKMLRASMPDFPGA